MYIHIITYSYSYIFTNIAMYIVIYIYYYYDYTNIIEIRNVNIWNVLNIHPYISKRIRLCTNVSGCATVT